MQPSSIIPMQHQTLPVEGLALTWDPVSGAIRYAFIIGLAGVPVPPIEAIMGGKAREFALLGVPSSFTGAALIGAAGEDRQLGVMAYMADGASIPVPNLQFHSARRAPRDRQYHPLLPPALAASPASAQPAVAPPPQERKPTPLTPLRGGDPWDALDQANNLTPTPVAVPAMTAAPDATGGLPMQQQRLTREGLSLLWDPMPDAIRYGLVAGVVGMPPPAIEALMRGGSRQFTILGIPARFTGATILGAASEEDRQFCLIAWRADGTMAPVSGVRFLPVRTTPRDRDYHPLTPPSLEAAPAAPAGTPTFSAPPVQSAPTIPSVSPQAVPPMADAARRQTAAEAFAAMMAARQAGLPAPPPPTIAPPPVPVVPPVPQRQVDPWDLLGAPSAPEEERTAPTPWIPVPTAHVTDTPPPVSVAPPQAADPWDLLGPSREPDSKDEDEEASSVQPIPNLPDPWDLLKEPEPEAHPAESIADVPTATPVWPSADTATEAPAHDRAPEPHEAHVPEPAPGVEQILPVIEPARARTEQWPEQTAVPPLAPVDESRPTSGELLPHSAAAPFPPASQEDAPAIAPEAPTQRSEPISSAVELERPAPVVVEETAATPEAVAAPEAAAIEADTAARPEIVPAPPQEVSAAAAGPQGAAPDGEGPAAVPQPEARAESTEGKEEPEQATGATRQERIDPVVAEPAPAAAETIVPISEPVRLDREAGDHLVAAPIADEPVKPDTAHHEQEVQPIVSRQDAVEPVVSVPTIAAEAPPLTGVDEPSPEPATPVPSGPEEIVPVPDHGLRVAAAAETHAVASVDAAPPAEPEPVLIPPVEKAPSVEPALLSAVTPIGAEGTEGPATEVRADDRDAESGMLPLTEVDVAKRSAADAVPPEMSAEPAPPAAPAIEEDGVGTEPRIQPVPLDAPAAAPAATQAPVVPSSEQASVEAIQAIEPPPADEKKEEPAEAAVVSPAPRLETEEQPPVAQEAIEPEAPPISPRPEPSPMPAEAAVAGPAATADVLTPREQPAIEPAPVEERRVELPREDAAPVVVEPEQVAAVARPTPLAVNSEDVWLTDDTTPSTAPPPTPPPTIPVPVPAAAPARPATAPPDTGPLAPALAALLEEAELYLLPQWADYAEVARLLDQVEQAAPNHARVRELRAQLQQTQQDAAGDGVAALLTEAEECIGRQDYWGAVDIYEQALQRQPGHEEAQRGIERARMLARWSSHFTGAGNDPARLSALGDEYTGIAPDLARQAYAAAFAGAPAVATLRGWLLALLHTGGGSAVAQTARAGMQSLQQRFGFQQSTQLDEALATVAARGEPQVERQEAERAISAFIDALEVAIGSPPGDL